MGLDKETRKNNKTTEPSKLENTQNNVEKSVEEKKTETLKEKDSVISVEKIENKELAQPFEPYTLEYLLELDGECEKDRHKENKICDVDSEKQIIEYLSNHVNEKHKRIWVDDGLPGLSHTNKLPTDKIKELEPYEKAFDIVPRGSCCVFFLCPKIVERKQHEDGIVKTTYLSGVIEELKTVDNDRYGVRIFPNGIIEKGKFSLEDGEPLEEGYRLENGKHIFYSPHWITTFQLKDDKLYLAEIDIDGKKEIVALLPRGMGWFDVWKEIPIDQEILLRLAQGWQGQYLQEIFNCKSITIKPEAFIEFLMTKPTLQGIEKEGTPPIFTLSKEGVEHICLIASGLKLHIDLRMINPATGKTLFSTWIGEEKLSNSKIKSIMVEDPSLALDKTPRGRTFFAHFLLHGKKKIADLFLQTMKDQKVELSPSDVWLKRIAEDDDTFKEEEFRNLDSKTQTDLYRLANTFSCRKAIVRLNELSMEQISVTAPPGLSFIAPNMNLLQVEETIRKWFQGLREKNLLLTETEFKNFYSTKRDECDKKTFVRSKGRDIGRILGRNYIEQTCKELGLKHVKVPKKIAVLDTSETDESSAIKVGIEVIKGHIEMVSDNFEIYAENITRVERKLTCEEMEELIILLKKTRFDDIHCGNFIVAEEGIYIIDTEFTNFITRVNSNLYNLGPFIDKKDGEWFLEKVSQSSIKLSDKEKEENLNKKEQRKKDLKNFGFTYGSRSFRLDPKDLFLELMPIKDEE